MSKKGILTLVIAVTLIALGSGAAPPPPGPPPPPPPAPTSVSAPSLPSFFDPYYGYHYSLKVISTDPDNKNFIADIGGAIAEIQTDEKTIFYRLEEKHGKREYFEAEKFFNYLKPSQLIWLRGQDTKKRIFSIQVPTNYFEPSK